MGKIIESACEFAVQLANDDSHGYDQINRWLPDVDCSSLVVLCYEHAGIPVKSKGGATYTGNLKSGFQKCGFTVIPFKPVKPALKRGDVLFYHYVKDKKTHGHAIIYLGNGKIVQASISENGTITGKTGDQTKREVAIGNFYIPAYGWDYVLRYPENEEEETVDVNMPVLRKGSRCAEVGTVQTLYNALGYTGKNGRPLTVDHDFGDNVEFATKNFQKDCGLNPDGIIGLKSWPLLLKANY